MAYEAHSEQVTVSMAKRLSFTLQSTVQSLRQVLSTINVPSAYTKASFNLPVHQRSAADDVVVNTNNMAAIETFITHFIVFNPSCFMQQHGFAYVCVR